MTWDEVVDGFDRPGRHPPPRRRALVPAHRPGAGKRNDRTVDEARPLSRPGPTSTTTCSPTGPSAWSTGSATRPPAGARDQPGLLAGAGRPRPTPTPPTAVFVSERQVRFREMEYAVPREAGMPALVEARRADRAGRLADQLPRRAQARSGRRRVAVHGPRAAVGLPGLPRQRAHRPHGLLPGVEAVMRDHGGRRTGESCTPARPRTWPRPTRAGTTSPRCATASTPSGCSPTPTSTGCSADEATDARAAGPGQESVWDYPRPPRLERTPSWSRSVLGGRTICSTRAAYRVLETSHPPTYYLPRPTSSRAPCGPPTARRSASGRDGPATSTWWR